MICENNSEQESVIKELLTEDMKPNFDLSSNNPLELWKFEFTRELGMQTGLFGSELLDNAAPEMENWIDSGDWADCSPKDAVTENLSCWGD